MALVHKVYNNQRELSSKPHYSLVWCGKWALCIHSQVHDRRLQRFSALTGRAWSSLLLWKLLQRVYCVLMTRPTQNLHPQNLIWKWECSTGSSIESIIYIFRVCLQNTKNTQNIFKTVFKAVLCKNPFIYSTKF